MALNEIKAAMAKLPAAKNCALFLWIANELLDEIKDVCAAGGFKYRSYYPTCPKLEMFYRPLDDPAAEQARRAKREAAGWYVSGNEAEAIPQAAE